MALQHPGAWLGLSCAALSAACSGVLGLDAPTLDPCLSGGCADATTLVDATPPSGDDTGGSQGDDAGVDSNVPVDAGRDTAPDTAPPPDTGPLNGTRCGSGATAIGCTGSTSWCCEVTDNTGSPAYACVSGQGACDDAGGYAIQCASNADCSGNDVCCHFNSSIKCESSCSNSSLVCDPDGSADQCPNTGGWKCGAQIDGGGTTLPYYLCTQ